MRHNLSKITLVLAYAFILMVGLLFYPKWTLPETEATLSWDVSGYYMYLPAFFIYDNPKELNWVPQIVEKYKPTHDYQQAFKHESGNYVFKYSSGLSVLMSPFFAIGHAVASLNSIYPADGFSKPYQMSIGLGMLIYTFIGLWFFRKILLEYFSEISTSISIILLVFGTNYLNFAAIDHAMTHGPLFAIYSIIIWHSINFYKSPSIRRTITIGLCIGLASLIRPTEIMAIFIPLLWNTSSLLDLKERFLFFTKNFKHILICAAGIIAIGSIQLFYWKYATGSWIVYSYGEQGFSWFRPHFFEYWFNPERGWLRYSPSLLLYFGGLFFIIKKSYPWIAVFAFSSLYIYVTAAWDVTWYGGRAMIQSYPILFFPIAALIEYCTSSKALKILLIILVSCFVYYNIWYTHYLHNGSLKYVTHAYWKATVGRFETLHPDAEYLLDNEDWHRKELPKNKKIIFNKLIDSAFGKMNGELYVNDSIQNTPKFLLNVPANANWLRATAQVRQPLREHDLWKMPQFIIAYYREGEIFKSNFVRASRKIRDNAPIGIFTDSKIPNNFDEVKLYIWNAGSQKELFATDIEVYAF